MSSLMTLSCITLVIPAAYHSSQVSGGVDIPSGGLQLLAEGGGSNSDAKGLLLLSRGTSIILFGVYIS
jgi:Ca2+:H+ antiporter